MTYDIANLLLLCMLTQPAPTQSFLLKFFASGFALMWLQGDMALVAAVKPFKPAQPTETIAAECLVASVTVGRE